MHYLCLFCADGKTKVVAGIRELVNVALHVSLSGSVEGAVIGEQEVVDGVSLDLGFCLKPPEIECGAISPVLDANAYISITEGICQHG